MRILLCILVLSTSFFSYAKPLAELFKVSSTSNASAVKANQNSGNQLTLLMASQQLQTVINGNSLSFTVERFMDTPSGKSVWLGKSSVGDGLSLIASSYGLSGHLRRDGQVWSLVKRGKDDYAFVINEELGRRQQVDDSIPQPAAKDSDALNSQSQGVIERHTGAGFSESNQINILVYYSSEAREYLENIEDLIELEFVEANAAFSASGINTSLSLAATIEIDDFQQSDNLYDMRDGVGAYQTLSSLRNQYQADLVHFFGSKIGYVCGRAWYAVDRSGWSEEDFGYGVTSQHCFGNLTFAHEIGHNLGAKHDRYVESGGDDYFNYGYVDVENEQRTIMAYWDECADSGASCERIPFFSNPDVLHKSVPVGGSRDLEDPANNALMIGQTANIVANFRGVGAPQNVLVEINELNELEVSWNDFPNAHSYQVYTQWHSETQCNVDQYDFYLSLQIETEELETSFAIPQGSGNLCVYVVAIKDYEWVDKQQVRIQSLFSLPALINVAGSDTSIQVVSALESYSGNVDTVFDVNITNAIEPRVSVMSESLEDQFDVRLEQIEGDSYNLVVSNNYLVNGYAQIEVNDSDQAIKHVWLIENGFTNQPPQISAESSISLSQTGSVTIPVTVTDELPSEFIVLGANSDNNGLLSAHHISVDGNQVTLNLKHELTGSLVLTVSAFDGELISTQNITVNIDRTLYNEPIVPEQIDLFVDGFSSLTRELPGEDLDGDALVYSLLTPPQHGQLVIEEHTFTYFPANDFSEDSFVLSVLDGSSEIEHQTKIQLRHLGEVALPYQQNLNLRNGRAIFLSHRGELYSWGNVHDEYIATPMLMSEGWVDFEIGPHSYVLFLKANGTLWYQGPAHYIYANESSEVIGPVQFGTERDWLDIQTNRGFGDSIIVTKQDGSLWSFGNPHTNNIPEYSSDQGIYPLTPIQMNGLYHWQSAVSGEKTMYLDINGQVWSSGTNRAESLARPERHGFLSPIEFDLAATKIASSLWRGFAETADGIYGWGSYNYLSDSIDNIGVSDIGYHLPELVNTAKWLSTSYSTYGFIGVDHLNQLYTSSTIARPYLGRGDSDNNLLTVVGGKSDWRLVYATSGINYAIDLSGQVWVAGETDYNPYELGLGDPNITEVNEFTMVTAIPVEKTGMRDLDADGIIDYLDPDDDNDGVIDSVDDAPDNGLIAIDTDGDGIDNSVDPDDDNDGVNDEEDAFPLDATEWLDTDSDGIGNNADEDDDNDGVNDEEDAFPLDATEWLDTDSDGIGNNADEDDDNDGVNDEEDAFPLDATEWLDTDSDGIGNNADEDDDNDGVNDEEDAFPLDATEWLDTDADGIGNNEDTDDDGDGTQDSADAYPLDPSRSLRVESSINGDSGGGTLNCCLLLFLASMLIIRRKNTLLRPGPNWKLILKLNMQKSFVR